MRLLHLSLQVERSQGGGSICFSFEVLQHNTASEPQRVLVAPTERVCTVFLTVDLSVLLILGFTSSPSCSSFDISEAFGSVWTHLESVPQCMA